VQNRHFSSFFVVTSPLREGVEVLGITPHLLNVSVLGTTHGLYFIGVHRAKACAVRQLVGRTQQRIVRSLFRFLMVSCLAQLIA